MITWLIWTIWTPMSSVPKEADKRNLSLSLSLSLSLMHYKSYTNIKSTPCQPRQRIWVSGEEYCSTSVGPPAHIQVRPCLKFLVWYDYISILDTFSGNLGTISIERHLLTIIKIRLSDDYLTMAISTPVKMISIFQWAPASCVSHGSL